MSLYLTKSVVNNEHTKCSMMMLVILYNVLVEGYTQNNRSTRKMFEHINILSFNFNCVDEDFSTICLLAAYEIT